ncbi:thiamine phosphate synthase [bacterium]|nr:thiamine phosphate synthase [bacterium]
MSEIDIFKKTDIKQILIKDIIECYSIKINGQFIEDEVINSIALILNNNCKMIQMELCEVHVLKFLNLAQKIHQLCSIYNALFIIKSRADIAKILDSDGLLLDNTDYSFNQAVEIIGHDKIVGYFYKKSEIDHLDDINLFNYILIEQDDYKGLKSNLNALNKKIIIKKEIIL